MIGAKSLSQGLLLTLLLLKPLTLWHPKLCEKTMTLGSLIWKPIAFSYGQPT